MKEEEKQPIELPENAFRELGEGEEYQPERKEPVYALSNDIMT